MSERHRGKQDTEKIPVHLLDQHQTGTVTCGPPKNRKSTNKRLNLPTADPLWANNGDLTLDPLDVQTEQPAWFQLLKTIIDYGWRLLTLQEARCIRRQSLFRCWPARLTFTPALGTSATTTSPPFDSFAKSERL